MSDFKPTDEQVYAQDMAASGETFVMDAVAGSGKTTTAREMCKVIDGRALYLVYNKSAAEDAKKSFPRGVKVSTTSALAWGRYPEYRDRMVPGAKRVRAKDTAALAGLTKPLQVGVNMALSPVTITSWALETITKFCYSADIKISEKHVPPLAAGLEALQEDMVRTEVAAWARKIWTDAIKVNSQHRFTFDYAFKLMVLSPPDLGYDAVLIDEAQDSNWATLHLLKAQINSQLIAIGDPAQQLYCQPLGTQVEKVHQAGRGITPARTGGVAIEDLQVGDRVVTYDKAYVSKGGCEITRIDRFPYTGTMVDVTTESGLSSSYTEKHHCMVRIGDNLVDKRVVYLMRRGGQYRVGCTRMTYHAQRKGFGVALCGRREKADAAWILSLHDDPADATLDEMLIQHEFNIPGVDFEPTSGNAAAVRSFWERIGDNTKSGEECLAHFGRLPGSPLWHSGITQEMSIRTVFPTAAANVMEGMSMLPLRNMDAKQKATRPAWETVSVSRSYYDGDVVSLTVDKHHNYFADGILTHNSWRGASDIMGEFGGQRLPLSKSFRFGPAIAEEANKWLGHTQTPIRVTGNEDISSVVVNRPLDQTDAILCRTNATAMERAIEELDAGKKVAIVGGTDALRNLAHAANDLMGGKRTSHPELSAFADWSELMAFTEEPGGGDLKALVQLINTYKVGGILNACNRLVPETPMEARFQKRTYVTPDVVCSTAHKSKGREWMNVEVADDFEEPEDVEDPLGGETEPGPISRHDAMLHYVTVTRARKNLNRGGLSWIDRHPSVDKTRKVL